MAQTLQLTLQRAQDGHPQAQYDVGVYYERGYEDTPKNINEAIRWYRLASSKGHVDAQSQLAILEEWLKKLSSSSSSSSSSASSPSSSSSSSDLTETIRLYRLASEQGNAWAQNNLGYFYYHGQGVSKDVKEAIRWFTLSAGQGERCAQFNLGQCYYHGISIEEDFNEAIRFYGLAAKQGCTKSKYSLGFCYEYGQGVEVDMKEAVRWYREAKEHPHAQIRLGLCYEEGNGVERNFNEACRIYELVYQQGNNLGKECLDSLSARKEIYEQETILFADTRFIDLKTLKSGCDGYIFALELMQIWITEGSVKWIPCIDEATHENIYTPDFYSRMSDGISISENLGLNTFGRKFIQLRELANKFRDRTTEETQEEINRYQSFIRLILEIEIIDLPKVLIVMIIDYYFEEFDQRRLCFEEIEKEFQILNEWLPVLKELARLEEAANALGGAANVGRIGIDKEL